jgi:RNA polymerase sigma factor (sigma-70 family)
MTQLPNEADILLRVSRAEQEAFRELVSHYRPVQLSYITTFTRSRERAEEIVQDVWMQIWSVRATLPEIRNFQRFMVVVSRNLALNAIRDHVREKARKEKWLSQGDHPDSIQPEAFQSETNILDEAVARLPPQQQKVWIATRREGKKLAQVAQEMNLTLASIKKYVQLANKSITAFIVERGDLMLLITLFWKK